jgi:hypothetical protein
MTWKLNGKNDAGWGDDRIVVDVNGFKGPNKYNLDQLVFRIDDTSISPDNGEGEIPNSINYLQN